MGKETKVVPIADSRGLFDHPELTFLRAGKVRDIWEINGDPDHLVIFTTDRVSAFDAVLPTPIPGKGLALKTVSGSWLRFFSGLPNHNVSPDELRLSDSLNLHLLKFIDRIDIVDKALVPPAECVVRGYITGGLWKDYVKGQPTCGIVLPKGLKEADRLPEPIFTPTTKEEGGHDKPLDEKGLIEVLGQWVTANSLPLNPRQLAADLKAMSLDLYRLGYGYALNRRILVADTKFEFGWMNGEMGLVDEALTSDSSRFWREESWKPGATPVSLDKQFIRDYLDSLGWDHQPPAPPLPPDVVAKTQELYFNLCQELFGIEPW